MSRTRLLVITLGSVFVAHTGFAQTAPGRVAPDAPLSDLGRKLDDNGVRISAQVIDEYAHNPTGGVRQGETNVGQIRLGANFDLDKIFGLHGGNFYITGLRDYGSSLAKDYSGTYTKEQEIYKNQYNLWRFSVAAYEQKLFDDTLDVYVGRMGTTTFYGRLANTCYFQSGMTCTVPQVLNSAAGYSLPTSATWAGNVRYKPRPDFYIQAGAFEVNQYIQHTNGFDWSTGQATGVTVTAEAGFGDYNLQKIRYPGDIKFGGYVSTAPVSDPLYNTKGKSLGISGGTAAVSSDQRQGIYGMGEKVVWRPEEGSRQSLALFGGWIQPLETEEVMRLQTYAGAVLRAPFESRPSDAIAFVTNYYNISSRELEFLHDSRIKAGGKGWNDPNEVTFELDYDALLVPSIRLSPNIQYFINPDNSNIPKTSGVPKNMFVLGVKVTFNIGNILGLPSGPTLAD